MYDIITGEMTDLYPPLPPLRSIRALEVVWSPNDEFIAVAGDEHPFPVTEHGINDLKTLYILNPETAEYVPISESDTEVEFGELQRFVWLSNQRLGFVSYRWSSDNQTSEGERLNITGINGHVELTLSGPYHLFSALSDDRLLLYRRDNHEFEFLLFQLGTQQLTSIVTLPVDEITPYPYFSLSPQGDFLSYYVAVTDEVKVTNLRDLSTHMLDAPVEEYAGEWHPNEKTLYFYDQTQNLIYRYDIESSVMEALSIENPSSESDGSLQFPSWICPN